MNLVCVICRGPIPDRHGQDSPCPLTDKLRRWATARERRNGPGGHGQVGTQLLRDAADAIEAREESLRAAYTAEWWNTDTHMDLEAFVREQIQVAWERKP